MPDTEPLDARGALDRLIHLGDHQPLRAKTRAAHAAAIYNADLNQLSVAEDVGRHNALDKAIGRLFLDDQLGRAHRVDPLVTHQLRTGSKGRPGEDPRHPGRIAADGPWP